MTYSVAAQTDFDPAPSAATFAASTIAVQSAVPSGAAVTAVPVSTDGELPPFEQRLIRLASHPRPCWRPTVWGTHLPTSSRR